MTETTINNRTPQEIAMDLSIPLEKRVKYALASRTKKGEIIDFPPTVSVHQLLQSKLIHWLKSYKTLLKYVSVEYVDIFKPTVLGTTTGTRYYVEVENIIEFLKKFDNNEFDKANKTS